MSLSKVLEEMKKVRPMAEQDTDSGPVETITARRGQKRNAQEQLKNLRNEYSDMLLRTAAFIVTVGSEAEAFNEAVTSDGSCLSAPAEGFYEDLAARVHPTLYQGKDPGANLFDVVSRHLEDKARELGITEYPQLLFKAQYRRMISSQSEFVSLLKQAVTEQVGGEIVGINAVRSLTDKAIKAEHKLPVTPVLLTTKDQEFAVSLLPHLKRLTPNVSLVVVGEASESLKATPGAVVVSEVNAKTVKGALKQIKNNLKK